MTWKRWCALWALSACVSVFALTTDDSERTAGEYHLTLTPAGKTTVCKSANSSTEYIATLTCSGQVCDMVVQIWIGDSGDRTEGIGSVSLTVPHSSIGVSHIFATARDLCLGDAAADLSVVTVLDVVTISDNPVCAGKTITFKALPNPANETFPANQPTWTGYEGEDTEAVGQGTPVLAVTNSSANGGIRNVTASCCGDSPKSEIGIWVVVTNITQSPEQEVVCAGTPVFMTAHALGGQFPAGSPKWEIVSGEADMTDIAPGVIRLDNGNGRVTVRAKCCEGSPEPGVERTVAFAKVSEVRVQESPRPTPGPLVFEAISTDETGFPPGAPQWEVLEGDVTPTSGTGLTFSVRANAGEQYPGGFYSGVVIVRARCNDDDEGAEGVGQLVLGPWIELVRKYDDDYEVIDTVVGFVNDDGRQATGTGVQQPTGFPLLKIKLLAPGMSDSTHEQLEYMVFGNSIPCGDTGTLTETALNSNIFQSEDFEIEILDWNNGAPTLRFTGTPQSRFCKSADFTFNMVAQQGMSGWVTNGDPSNPTPGNGPQQTPKDGVEIFYVRVYGYTGGTVTLRSDLEELEIDVEQEGDFWISRSIVSIFEETPEPSGDFEVIRSELETYIHAEYGE